MLGTKVILDIVSFCNKKKVAAPAINNQSLMYENHTANNRSFKLKNGQTLTRTLQ